jgi:ABC-2 type transport system ATP-binding protein
MLEVRGLTKLFSGIPAVDNVSFIAQPGIVTGYLGPNGSGKSTTVKMITGLIEPTEGKILWRGADIRRDPASFKAIFGYVPEEPYLYPHLSGGEYLELTGELRLIPRQRLAAKIEAFLRLFGLWEDRYTAITSYSKGMKQKILLAAALLHNPELVILDEPFSGLDVNSALVLRRLIQSLAESGKTILFSSHELETVERVCSRVVILYKGKAVANDSVASLRGLMALPSLEAIFTQLALRQNPDEMAASLIEAMQK